jgi:hypothetical protein
MKLITLLILMFISLKGFSCMCRFHKFEEACQISPHIFEGRFIQKATGKQNNPYYPLSLYKVVVLDIWKGELKDTVDLFTGIGGGDCGTSFDSGKTYLIWTSNQYGYLLSTNFCTRTRLIYDTPDVDLLNYKFKNMDYNTTYLTDRELSIDRCYILGKNYGYYNTG